MRIKKNLCKMVVVGVLGGVMSFAPNVVDVPIISGISVAYAQEDDAYMNKLRNEWHNLFIQHKYNEALNICNELIQAYPNRLNAYRSRGVTYQSMNQYDKALNDFDKVIELAVPDKDFDLLSTIYGDKARVYEAMHQPDKVRECREKEAEAYTTCIQKKPDYSSYYTLRASVYDELGDYQKAIEDYKKAISLPHYVDEETKKIMEKFGQKYDEYTMIAGDYYMCGGIYQKIKDYKNAVEMYSKAIELNPDDSIYYLVRQQCYEALGEKEKAKADHVEYEILSKEGK